MRSVEQRAEGNCDGSRAARVFEGGTAAAQGVCSGACRGWLNACTYGRWLSEKGCFGQAARQQREGAPRLDRKGQCELQDGRTRRRDAGRSLGVADQKLALQQRELKSARRAERPALAVGERGTPSCPGALWPVSWRGRRDRNSLSSSPAPGCRRRTPTVGAHRVKEQAAQPSAALCLDPQHHTRFPAPTPDSPTLLRPPTQLVGSLGIAGPLALASGRSIRVGAFSRGSRRRRQKKARDNLLQRLHPARRPRSALARSGLSTPHGEGRCSLVPRRGCCCSTKKWTKTLTPTGPLR
ncbi:hypothetical protein BU23DRAFT_135569 [Bimuria novae-zelandiae CBS 107.79]|uniref:Uncharacterized protein n=1 Tax=Bimuria novae-zelandiae CBS 107.79 TaxID=1447943 RepID=A0A6A5VAI2_9PLEO|nr:hypothetical protein BU23DRAFT_135569 [Bimuria novae-zelandiae CBS 107.79]